MDRRFGDHLSLRKAHLTLFHSLPFDIQCWAFDAQCSSPQGVVDSDPPCPWGANEVSVSLLIFLTWAGDSEITSPCEERTSRSSILFHSTFNVGRSMLNVSSPKEWWTPIRHAHEKPMGGESHSSLSSHGQAIRRSPLLAKSAPHALPFSFIRRSMLGVRCSTFLPPRSGGLRSAMPMGSQ
jgi:hypothetical protein